MKSRGLFKKCRGFYYFIQSTLVSHRRQSRISECSFAQCRWLSARFRTASPLSGQGHFSPYPPNCFNCRQLLSGFYQRAQASRHTGRSPFPLVKDVTPKAHANTTCYYKTKKEKKEEEKKMKKRRGENRQDSRHGSLSRGTWNKLAHRAALFMPRKPLYKR